MLRFLLYLVLIFVLISVVGKIIRWIAILLLARMGKKMDKDVHSNVPHTKKDMETIYYKQKENEYDNSNDVIEFEEE